jgi:predicted metalloprotease with PDZ domain
MMARGRTVVLQSLVLAGILGTLAAPAQGQPMQLSPAPARVPARDIAYPGIVRLEVDARDVDHRILRAREVIPTRGGEQLTLLYPMWMPGNHAPRGPIQNLAGLTISANGRKLEWQRDAVEMAAFHVTVPVGVRSIEVALAFLTPLSSKQGRIVFTSDFLNLPWNALLLYPAGHYARRIEIAPSLVLPGGWDWSTALAGGHRGDSRIDFEATTLETLIDSPVYAARHARHFQLDAGSRPVTLDVFAETASALEASGTQIEAHRAIIRQCDLLFGTRPFDRYHFLLSLSAKFGAGGTEHHQSSEDRSSPGYFRRWEALPWTRTLLPHEYIHAWNGKYRRPALTFTADYNTPTRNALLWVYEGLTNYYEWVIAARSGMITPGEAREMLAQTYAQYAQRPGREWRSLADTTNSAILSTQRPLPWPDYLRYVDYYDEGMLLWLEADALIRERSGGRRSLDDFMRRFFAGTPGFRGVSTYTFDDVVSGLEAVQHNDWRVWLGERLGATGKQPLTSLERTGFRLGFSAEPSPFLRRLDAEEKRLDLSTSVGLIVADDGLIQNVAWNSPAFAAGLRPELRIVALGSRAYSRDALIAAVEGAARADEPISILVADGDRIEQVSIRYSGGLRYPALVRQPDRQDLLGRILAPL